jgi:hypothetical protein
VREFGSDAACEQEEQHAVDDEGDDHNDAARTEGQLTSLHGARVVARAKPPFDDEDRHEYRRSDDARERS